ncbi:glycosyltransferase family protein [Anaerovorax odorimutans]|uniref:hypothetical protein n=1 Tax=Anaerovorax odorimutans TaxID=109327 RepID=UPI00041EF5CA|nr:hypothetical protein [Anaerovorax odorimutans]
MFKGVNFIYCNPPYDKLLDSIIDPILEYLPQATKEIAIKPEMLNISFFIESSHKSVSFMSHGIGDKGWRDGKQVKDYDYIFVSGPFWKEKLIYQGIDEEKIFINGFSKLDYIFKNRKKHLDKDDTIHVLYAPTHNTNLKDVRSSYPRLIESIKIVPPDIKFVSSLHPFNNKGVFTLDLFDWADVVISDCSSIIYEAFALDIPVVFPDWLVKEAVLAINKNTFTEMIYKNKIGYHANSIDELWEAVRFAARKGLDTETKNFIEGIFPGNLRGNSAKVTADLLKDICNSYK